MSQGTILVQRPQALPGLAVVVISNPDALNALTTQMQIDLIDRLRALRHDPAVRVVVLRGEGDRAFSSGGAMESLNDIHDDAASAALYQRGVDVRNTIEGMGKPVIAAVSGWCVGAGFEIAMCCDMLYAEENARFSLPEVNLGAVPGWGGAIRLPRKITVNRAKELILLGQPLPAGEAYMLGIVNRIFPKETLFDEVDKIARRLLNQPPLAVRAVKEIVSQGIVDGQVSAAQVLEEKYSISLANSHDYQEAVHAFLEKRKPKFEGR